MTALPDRAVNLSLVRHRLKEAEKHLPLQDVIGQAMVAQSCLADLREAEECCDALDYVIASPRKKNTALRNHIEMSLLSSATMLYARATSTNGKYGERGSIQIESKLRDRQQAEDHKALVDIRNQALAHVYPNEHVAGTEWHRTLVLLIPHPAGFLPSAASNRIQMDHNILARLRRQLPVAIEIISAKSQKRLEQVGKMLTKLKSDPLLTKLLLECRLDREAFFGSEKDAMLALDATPGASKSWIAFQRR